MLNLGRAPRRLQTAALDSIANMILITDVRGRINDALTRFIGYAFDETIAQESEYIKVRGTG